MINSVKNADTVWRSLNIDHHQSNNAVSMIILNDRQWRDVELFRGTLKSLYEKNNDECRFDATTI